MPAIHVHRLLHATDALPFPMMVVPLQAMLDVLTAVTSGKDEVMAMHEDIQAQGMLVSWKPGMKTIFFSHTWLGNSHPDPKGDKCKLMKALLEGILNGHTHVSGYWMATIIFQEMGEDITDEECRLMIDEHDLDGDEKLDFNEFVTLMLSK